MKIANVKTLELAKIPVLLPLQPKPVYSTVRLVSIETADGLVGISEIGHAPASATVQFIENDLTSFLKGKDPLDTEWLMHNMLWRFNNRAHSGVWNAAVSAIDVALWDIKGKYFNTLVWRLLGGAQKSVPAYITFGLRTYSQEELVEAAKTWVGQGQNRLKLMVGRLNIQGEIDMGGSSAEHREEDPAQDEARVRAVREAVGDGVELMVDAACLMRYEAALRWCTRLESYNLLWFEEPLLFNDVHQLAELRRQTSIPIAAGQWEDFNKLVEMARAGAVDFLNPEVGSVGGFTMGMKAAVVAQAFNLPIGNGGHYDMHLHAAVSNGWRTEFHLVGWSVSKIIYKGAPDPEKGWVTLPDWDWN
jgi:L-alanine-DL-glutamate epimerase-like enolase superfamily enzyme